MRGSDPALHGARRVRGRGLRFSRRRIRDHPLLRKYRSTFRSDRAAGRDAPRKVTPGETRKGRQFERGATHLRSSGSGAEASADTTGFFRVRPLAVSWNNGAGCGRGNLPGGFPGGEADRRILGRNNIGARRRGPGDDPYLAERSTIGRHGDPGSDVSICHGGDMERKTGGQRASSGGSGRREAGLDRWRAPRLTARREARSSSGPPRYGRGSGGRRPYRRSCEPRCRGPHRVGRHAGGVPRPPRHLVPYWEGPRRTPWAPAGL